MIDVATALEAVHAMDGSVRCTSLRFGDTVVWVKRPDPDKGNAWNAIHGLVSGLLGDMFRSTAVAGGPAALHAEADRLRRAKALGIPVPDVLHDGEDALLLSDCGESLAARLRREGDPARREAFLVDGIRALSALHARGLCHGRPFVRDMAVRDGVVHLLDFEEDPLRLMPLAKAQARDVWLYLQSASRFTGGDGDALVRIFRAWGPPDALPVRRELARFVRLLKPLRALAERLPGRWMGRDLAAALAANRALERALVP
jgi:hypothetical protein